MAKNALENIINFASLLSKLHDLCRHPLGTTSFFLTVTCNMTLSIVLKVK